MSVDIIEKPRTGVINPIFNCMPCGAQFAAIGLKDTIALVHGGQGCCTFVRLMFAQHFKENFDIASSSLHEDAAVFGGIRRVMDGVKVLASRYPGIKAIPIITTCSTETIGDDIEGCCSELEEYIEEEYPGRTLKLIPIHTPSYKGTQVLGYDIAVEAFVSNLAKKGEPNGKLNIFTGWVNPGDVTELKYMLSEMGVDATFLLDIENFDAPMMPGKAVFAEGGTDIEDFADSANAIASIALYKYEGGRAAAYLSNTFDVPSVIGLTTIGIANTDKFLQEVSRITGKEIPESLAVRRGKALDSMADLGHMFLAEKKVAIYGDPDLVIGLAEFCMECGMQPALLMFGDDQSGYAKDERVAALKEKADLADFDMEIVMNADLWELEKRLEAGLKIDLIMGHSKGRYLSIDYQIPMVRVGFPTFDRAGVWKHPVMGYKGAELLADEIANALFTDMEYKKDKDYILNVW